MSYQSKSIASGQTWQIQEAGTFFRLLTSVGKVRVEFYLSGSLKASIDSVYGGFWREGTFDSVRITDMSGGANVVEILMDIEHVGYDRVSVSGAINAQAINGTPTQTNPTVTSASAQLVAANANRRHLLIQNKDVAGSIFVNFAGAAATLLNGVQIGPGGSFESSASWVSSAAIFAIGDIASNANIVVIEGN